MTQQSTVSDMLGYPSDARLLIINADDFGMCHAANEATFQALDAGIVRSATVMAPCPWAPQALRWLREHPEFAFGVHLTLIAEHDDYRWGPLASRDAVPSLIDATGHFYREDQRAELLGRAVLAEVETEFRAQIAAVLAAGLRPTHLDWHCLADGGREDVFALTFDLAREFGLATRVHGDAAAEHCRRAGLPVSEHGILDSYSMPTIDKSARYVTLLRELPVGLSEWALHPSLGNVEAQAMEPDGWQVRRADFEFLLSPEARETVAAEGIVLLDYRALQEVWIGTST